MLAVLAIDVSVFFAYNISQPNKMLLNEKKRSTTKMTSYALKTYAINDYCSFDWKKSIEDSIKDGLIITATTTGIFYVLKAANVKLQKAPMDAMDLIKLAGGIMGGVLVKDYAVYKKWIHE